MVRERVRWSLFQLGIVGLQGLPRAQILFISLLQLGYFILIAVESKRDRIFKSIWLKMKVLFQELAIMVFLVVLCVISYRQKSG